MRSDTADHINQLRNEKLDRLDRAIIQTIHELGTTSAWEVYVAMNPRVQFKVFELICRTIFDKPIWS